MDNPLLLAILLSLVLLLPGFTLFKLGSLIIPSFAAQMISISRLVLISFFGSVSIYFLTGLIFSELGIEFIQVRWLWVVSMLFGSYSILKNRSVWAITGLKPYRSKWSFITFFLIATMFLMLSFQGGLLDILADGWWHMAYAQQMLVENSIWIERHPLVDKPVHPRSILYPPVWHISLSLIASGLNYSLPQIWHSVAAPVYALTVIAYMLFCRSLGLSRPVIFFSFVFFAVIIGGLNSYARISPWPANIAYIALYFSLAETFRLSDTLCQKGNRGYIFTLRDLVSLPILFHWTGIGFLGILLVGLHGVEAILYFLSMLAYLVGLWITQPSISRLQTDKYLALILISALSAVGFFLTLTLFRDYIGHLLTAPRAKEPYLNFIFPVLFVLTLFFISKVYRSKFFSVRGVRLVLFSGFAFMLILIFDFGHVEQLFFPESAGRHVPRAFEDGFGNRVWLPWWDHQLRGAMIYSGVIGIFCVIVNYLSTKNRASLFLLANTVLVVITLTSPYFFSLISFLIPLGSTYRVHLLLFTPIPIAMLLVRFFPYEIFKK